jgi:hypothetical protein
MITNQEHLNNLIIAAFHREMEIYQYQINVDNYTVMLAALPQENWPDDLVQYKEAAIDKLPESLDDDVVLTISEHQYRDRIRNLLRTEKVEQSKATRVRDALKAQIGTDYDSFVAAYKSSQQQNA